MNAPEDKHFKPRQQKNILTNKVNGELFFFVFEMHAGKQINGFDSSSPSIQAAESLLLVIDFAAKPAVTSYTI